MNKTEKYSAGYQIRNIRNCPYCGNEFDLSKRKPPLYVINDVKLERYIGYILIPLLKSIPWIAGAGLIYYFFSR